MAHISRGLSAWKASLNRSLLPDDEAIQQLKSSGEGFTVGHSVEDLAWPAEPLRTTLLRGLAKLGVSRFAQKYPAVQVRRACGCESNRWLHANLLLCCRLLVSAARVPHVRSNALQCMA
jgi:hypothetical protein